MRKIMALAVVTLAGCVDTSPVPVAWKDGANGATAARHFTECELAALNAVPRALTTTTTPTWRAPSNVQCTSYGNYVNCQDYGGQVYGGQSITQDQNQDLRTRVHAQCLRDKGYTTTTLPRCSAEQQKKGVHPITSAPMPKLSSVACVTQGGYVLR